MSRPPDPVSALAQAAQDLEQTIVHCSEAVAEAEKIKLNSEKNLARAGRALQKAAELREAMAGRLKELLAAIHAARGRDEDAAARIDACAGQVKSRLDQLRSLQQRSGDIAESVRGVAELAKAGKPKAEILAGLAPVEERVAGALEEARGAEFEDLRRDLDALKQMLAALRKKVESL